MVAAFIWRVSCYFCVGKLANMDKTSFSLDYDCYFYSRFLDSEVCANSVDPDQIRQISWFYNGLVKSRIESSGIPGLFLKQFVT